MKIYSMTATFGKLEHQTISFDEGLNVINAPNEWGKSTWCAFMVAMLYGLDGSKRTTATFLADKDRYAPWSGQPMSGTMRLNWNGRDITIERRTKGRLIFADFSAYETESGLPVTELTAANCGQMLLGVEREVFLRAGFLRLADLPVTQDEALRRRLNALVTTGDESGAADALMQKLRDLKNHCRHNKTGLLPQAETRKKEIEEKLAQISALQQQIQRFHIRQGELEALHKNLENHKIALAYGANAAYNEKLSAAQAAQNIALGKLQSAQDRCKDLPSTQEIQEALQTLSGLRRRWDDAHMQSQILPPPPAAPEVPRPFMGLSPEFAISQAKNDRAAYDGYQKQQSSKLSLLGILGLVCGAGLAIVPNLYVRVGGIVLALLGAIFSVLQYAKKKTALDKLRSLEEKYAPLSPNGWVSGAEEFARVHNAYTQEVAGQNAKRMQFEQTLAALKQEIDWVTKGASLSACEQSYQDMLAKRNALSDAEKEYKQAESFALALESAYKPVKAPERPDSLTYSEEETRNLLAQNEAEYKQLQLKLGQCMGQVENLGQETQLRNALAREEQQIARLEDTYTALTIAMATLDQASQDLQRRFAPKIAQRAQELFSALTDGRYNKLNLGQDLSVNVSAQGEDTLHAALWRSDGTIDQLYLALRLAVAEELTPDAPLVLDDALVRFDDVRLKTAMNILRDASKTKQILLFTCQERELHAQ